MEVLNHVTMTHIPSRLSLVVISVAPITNSKPLYSCVHLLCPVLSLFFKSIVKCSYSI